MPSKIFSIRPAKFQTTFFISCQILGQFAPSRAASCPGNDIFLFIFCHLPTFFYIKLAPWMPPGWMPGVVAPSAPPLHATDPRLPKLDNQSRYLLRLHYLTHLDMY